MGFSFFHILFKIKNKEKFDMADRITEGKKNYFSQFQFFNKHKMEPFLMKWRPLVAKGGTLNRGHHRTNQREVLIQIKRRVRLGKTVFFFF